MAAKHCAHQSRKVDKINRLAEKHLASVEKMNEKRHAELLDFLEYERKDAMAVEGDLNVNLRFLFVLFGFDIDRFIAEGLISEEDVNQYKEDLRKRAEETQQGSRLLKRFRELLSQRTQSSDAQPQSPPDDAATEVGAGEVSEGGPDSEANNDVAATEGLVVGSSAGSAGADDDGEEPLARPKPR